MPAAPPSKRPTDSAFLQQRLAAWQPILTPRWAIATFAIIGVVFVAIGFGLKAASDAVVEVSQQYDGAGTPSSLAGCSVATNGNGSVTPCSLTLTAPALMRAPVYLYYQLDNFYQNHRRYVASRSDAQLAGAYSNSAGDSTYSSCSPLAAVGANSSLLAPCGLIAYSVFNDTFTTSSVNVQETGIAWPSDLSKYANPSAAFVAANPQMTFLNQYAPTIANVTNEHFIVWMRVAALPSFRKLYGIINTDIQAGSPITFNIGAAFPVNGFSGRKSLVLSTTSFLGGKNAFLGIAYIVVGFICILLAILFGLRQIFGGRRLGDTSFLVYR